MCLLGTSQLLTPGIILHMPPAFLILHEFFGEVLVFIIATTSQEVILLKIIYVVLPNVETEFLC